MIDYKHFPFDDLREQQVKFISEFNLHKDSKYIVGNLPTGAGKSPLAISMCKSFGRGYILTVTKALQDQYEKDFKRLSFTSIKGKNSYVCKLSSAGNSCENGICTTKRKIKLKCIRENTCEYYNKVAESYNSDIYVTNYKYFFRTIQKGDSLNTKRDIMIFDEAHLLEDELVSIASVDLNLDDLQKRFGLLDSIEDMADQVILQKFPDDSDISAIKDWVKVVAKYLKKLYTAAEEQYNSLKSGGASDSEVSNAYQLFTDLDRSYGNLDRYINNQKEEWVHDAKNKVVSIRPLDVSWIFKKWIEPHADKFVFLSATILDPLTFSYTIGINPLETAYIATPSSFDPTKSPVILTRNCKTDYKSLQDLTNLEVIKKTVEDILKMHKDQKGIIHTGNMNISKYLKHNLKSPRLLVRLNEDTNDVILKDHKLLKGPTVLVSSSMTEGVDLAGDLSRFQIIIKSPFLSLGDKRVKKLSDKFPDWYQLKMLEKLVQACGRSTRSEEDSSRTYILDSKAKYWIDLFDKKGWVPQDFKNRIIVI